jgi:hypothetical protein
MLEQILKIRPLSGKAALQGTIVHQVFEWMAKLKRKNKTHIDPMWLLEQAWIMHTKRRPDIQIRRETSRGEAADFKKCRLAVEYIVNSKFNPYNMKIIDSERWFDIPFDGEEWECINETNDKVQFSPRGYIDLVHEIDQDTIEIIDWKTGKREDFYTRQEYDFKKLLKDIQLRLYHLAACKLYPQYKNILVTFHFILDGGPITIPPTDYEISLTIQSLAKFLSVVKADTLIIRNRNWRCRMCGFQKEDTCNRIWSDLHAYGSEYIENKYGKNKQSCPKVV